MRNHCRSSSYYSMMLLSIILLCSISHSDASFSERKSFLDILGLSERVVGGKPVADDMFPWIVFIQANHKYKNNTQTSNLCGGSLIHARLVWLFHLSYLAHEVRATLHGRWNDVKALKRRRNNVVLMSCAGWANYIQENFNRKKLTIIGPQSPVPSYG